MFHDHPSESISFPGNQPTHVSQVANFIKRQLKAAIRKQLVYPHVKTFHMLASPAASHMLRVKIVRLADLPARVCSVTIPIPIPPAAMCLLMMTLRVWPQPRRMKSAAYVVIECGPQCYRSSTHKA
jgi:hypothetical protein